MTRSHVLPGNGSLSAAQIPDGLDLITEIKRLCREKNAVILAHYYQDGAIQDVADFVGDSLDLSRMAASTDAEMIVFCGVKFMAEVAKILSPDKMVVIPDAGAGCSLEDSCEIGDFKAFREAHPDHLCLTYINCSAEVKAASDIIVTSSNAEAIVAQIPEDQKLIFAPDQHLGGYIAAKTGRDMKLWPGACIVHEDLGEDTLLELKKQHPGCEVIAHPECPLRILRHADHVGSTSALLAYVSTTLAKDIIVATERHIIHQMKREAPDKNFIPAPTSGCMCENTECPYMALNTLEKLYLALKNDGPQLEIDADLRAEALRPLQRMLVMSPKKAASALPPLPEGLDTGAVDRLIANALSEDLGPNGIDGGDVTSFAVIPEDKRFSGVMVARHPMTVAGLPVAKRVFATVAPDISFTPLVKDGVRVEAGGEIARITGPGRALLMAERPALNLLQIMSGIATLTAQYVAAIADTKAQLLDTRKTIPGLRSISKYAARMGGAVNHRIGLFDMVLIKDNHLAICGGVDAAVTAAKAAGYPDAQVRAIEVECDTLQQVAEAVAAGADSVLLDNMPPDILCAALEIINGRCKAEASGGVTLDSIRAIAETGVDYVSVGRITQSAPAVDIGLDWS